MASVAVAEGGFLLHKSNRSGSRGQLKRRGAPLHSARDRKFAGRSLRYPTQGWEAVSNLGTRSTPRIRPFSPANQVSPSSKTPNIKLKKTNAVTIVRAAPPLA